VEDGWCWVGVGGVKVMVVGWRGWRWRGEEGRGRWVGERWIEGFHVVFFSELGGVSHVKRASILRRFLA
jgi:hypothetical protein